MRTAQRAGSRAAVLAAQSLLAQGFQVPTWAALVEAASPASPAEDDVPPPCNQAGVGSTVPELLCTSARSRCFFLIWTRHPERCCPRADPASCALTLTPSGPDLAIPNEKFRVLLRRLRLALPLTPQLCWWCRGALDALAAMRAHAQTLLKLPTQPADTSDGADFPLRTRTRHLTSRWEFSFHRSPTSTARTHKRCGPPRQGTISILIFDRFT